MQRAQRRQGRQAHSILLARSMGLVAACAALLAAVAVEWPLGFAVASFLGISALVLVAFSDPR